jgi:hypothetical protein
MRDNKGDRDNHNHNHTDWMGYSSDDGAGAVLGLLWFFAILLLTIIGLL